MNYTCDIDLFREWARAVTFRRFEAPTVGKYNTAIIFKRAKGHGRITRIDGLDDYIRRFRDHIAEQRLLPIGTQRRNRKRTLVPGGFLLVRHAAWDQRGQYDRWRRFRGRTDPDTG